MRIRELKEVINKLSEKQLEKNLIVVAHEKTFSCLGNVIVSSDDLIFTGEDDPCELVTKQSLIEEGYEDDEIEEFDVIIKEGQLYVEIQ